jgi:hypothetical protein
MAHPLRDALTPHLICAVPLTSVSMTSFRTPASSSSTTRAQRASARHLNGTPQASDPPAPTQAAASSGTQPAGTLDVLAIPCDSEEPSGSRSDSGHITLEGRSASVTAENSTTRRDKGKGVDVERGISRVKEEPQPVSLQNADSVNSLVCFSPALVAIGQSDARITAQRRPLFSLPFPRGSGLL